MSALTVFPGAARVRFLSAPARALAVRGARR